ncbi:hypothetical protein ACWEWF_45745, partial [Streptomyces sp. NPDC003857]
MSSRYTTAITGSLVTASFSAVMIFACTATADDQGGMSSKGGKAVDKAPAGVELTTLLPEKISVDNGSHKTAITAVVKNGGTKDSGKIRLLVAGFDGLVVTNVKGCSEIAEKDLPPGSNRKRPYGFCRPEDRPVRHPDPDVCPVIGPVR